MKGMLVYGVDGGEVESFVCGNRVVADFLAGKASSTRIGYGRALAMFFKWLRVKKGLVLSPSEFLNEHLRRRGLPDVEERRWALRLVLEFTRDNPDMAERSGSHRYGPFSTLKSFCAFNEADLTSSKNVFGKRGGRKFKVKQMSVDMARKVLGCLNQRSRAICLIMLQSGMSVGDVLNKFNPKLNYLRSCIRAGQTRIKIEVDERKGNNFEYFTFISVDAIQELKKWLMEREAIVQKWNEPEKVVFVKAENGRAFDVLDFEGEFRYYTERAGLKNGPYSVHSHMLRKLFKTESRPPERGIDQDCVEFMMGHLSGIASIGGIYDRSPELYGDMIEKEYAKLEPFINVYSGRASSFSLSDTDKAILERFKDPAFQEKQEALEEAYELLSDPDMLEKLRALKKVHFNPFLSHR